jgi:probable F420-dependent oxidoreductase
MPIVDLAIAARERGFSSIFLNEHTHLPMSHPRSQWPGGPGPTPETYGRFWDPLVALSFVAAATDLTVGTAVCLVAQHDAIALAKAVATLDVMSGGRVVFGVGWGWNREEFEDHGRGPANRRADVALEHVEAMTALWREESCGFDGAHVRFAPSAAFPKPLQRPRPPVLLGAPASERNLARVVAHADGWIPMGPNVLFEDGLESALAGLRAAWAEAGREPEGPRISVIQAAHRADRLAAALDRADALGIERVIVYVGEMGQEESIALLERLAPAC